MARYSMEITYSIYNDDTGEKLTVGPDGDGLDLISIKNISSDGNVGQELTITEEQAPLLIEAIQKRLKNIEKNASKI